MIELAEKMTVRIKRVMRGVPRESPDIAHSDYKGVVCNAFLVDVRHDKTRRCPVLEMKSQLKIKLC